jgi:hypothetical protein
VFIVIVGGVNHEAIAVEAGKRRLPRLRLAMTVRERLAMTAGKNGKKDQMQLNKQPRITDIPSLS